MPDELFTEISFYVVAHADDWQLFMQPNVYEDLVTPRSKVVFIITTAGDAGLGETYWAAREEGMRSSLRFCLAPLGSLKESRGTRELNQHTINYSSINNVTCCFCRLPDGNINGSGFPAYNNQSLLKLRSDQTNSINAIDNSTIYKTWQDFYTTLQTIILTESHGISNMSINYLNPDITANANDHADHITTGQAIQDLTIISTLRQTLFVGYRNTDVYRELSPKAFFWKAGMFAAYEKAVFDIAGYSTLHEDIDTYIKWCSNRAVFITIHH